MQLGRLFAAFGALASLPALAGAQSGPIAAATVDPSWQMTRIDNQCWLARTFGTAPNQVVAGLVPDLTALDSASLALLTPSAAANDVSGAATLSIDGRPVPDSQFEATAIASPRARLVRITSIHLRGPALRHAAAIQIAADGAQLRLNWRSIEAAWPRLEACLAEQRAALGIDVRLLRAREDESAPGTGTPPGPVAHAPAYWITDADYPADALHAGVGGTVVMVWRIGTDGHVHDCRFVLSSGSPSLDAASCGAITRRGLYQPATDGAGHPVDSYAMRRVVWRVPR